MKNNEDRFIVHNPKYHKTVSKTTYDAGEAENTHIKTKQKQKTKTLKQRKKKSLITDTDTIEKTKPDDDPKSDTLFGSFRQHMVDSPPPPSSPLSPPFLPLFSPLPHPSLTAGGRVRPRFRVNFACVKCFLSK